MPDVGGGAWCGEGSGVSCMRGGRWSSRAARQHSSTVAGKAARQCNSMAAGQLGSRVAWQQRAELLAAAVERESETERAVHSAIATVLTFVIPPIEGRKGLVDRLRAR